jgi:hypothetical protein
LWHPGTRTKTQGVKEKIRSKQRCSDELFRFWLKGKKDKTFGNRPKTLFIEIALKVVMFTLHHSQK